MIDYYAIKKEDLGSNSKIPICKLNSITELAISMAEDIAELIRQKNMEQKKCVIILPVGPVYQYPYLVDIINKNKISLKNVWIINMDEYLDNNYAYIDIGNKLSFRAFMRNEFYRKISRELLMPEEQQVFPDPENLDFIGGFLKENKADACYGGIGITGHIAFNEPENVTVDEYLQKPARVVELSPETRTTNAINDLNGALEMMPQYAVTIGMKEIYSAKKIRLYCMRDWHRSVVRRACYGDITAKFPVTLLQNHNDVTITVNDVAAGAAI